MSPATLAAWRTALGYNRGQASRALGLSRKTYQWYEDGRAEIPHYVALACAALWARLPAVEDMVPR